MQSEWWKTFFTGVALDLWRQAVTPEQTRIEADCIEKVLRIAPPAKVLDVPCGNGRLSLELASRGYQLTGVDIAADFIDEARTKATDGQLTSVFDCRDMRNLPWSEEFEGAFCFGNSFGYLDDEGNVAFIQAVARALKPGARIVIDTAMIAEVLLPALQERRWFEIGDILFLVHNRYDHVLSRMNTEYIFIREGTVERRSGSQRVHTYRELCRLLEEAGFGDFEGYGSATMGPFKLGSHRLLLVATKGG